MGAKKLVDGISQPVPQANFTLKLVRPGVGPAAELPASSLARWRHDGWCARRSLAKGGRSDVK